MNEAETRAEHIDPALKAAGWGVVEGSRIRREYPITLGRIEGHGKRGKALTADYVLEYRNTKLAVVEAKAWDKPLTEGVGQAKDYAGKLAIRFAFATNGQGIYQVDMGYGTYESHETYTTYKKEAEVTCYPTPDELWNLTFAEQNAWRDRFAKVPFEDRSGYFQGRYYQDIAIERVLEAIADNRQRILLTLATGTGKTFIAFQIAWKLFHSRWNLTDWKKQGEPTRRPRILFLADRNILADQAYNAFSAFPEDALVRIAPDEIKKKGKVPKNGSIFFTIFQTFMSGPNEAPNFGEYPPDFFDFIVIDECHRGGANDESSWRSIMEYFAPAVQLGLTATPKREDNVNTYAYFGKRYEEPDFNKIIEIKEREKKRVEIFMSQIDQREKTLVFCANQAHALAVRDLINQMKSSIDPNYCQRVTANDGALGEQHLRDFQDNEKTIPTILTTSQKLSTGVDARNIRNIVLMRPINRIIEFKQIIGRGTRLYDGKDYFTIYDFVKAYHHFSDPEWDGEPVGEMVGEIGPIRPMRPIKVRETTPDFPKKQKAKIKLADGKERTIQYMVATSFWHPDGTPMSAQQFMEALFGKLPEFFKDEEELRSIWSAPDTRKAFLARLAEAGFGKEQMTEMQKIIDAEKSDLFDVLAYVAFALQPVTREARATRAKGKILTSFTDKQRAFLDFVLSQYVKEGVDELDQEKLSPLLKLRYHDSIPDAVADLGKPDEIGRVFVGFQKYLYQQQPTV